MPLFLHSTRLKKSQRCAECVQDLFLHLVAEENCQSACPQINPVFCKVHAYTHRNVICSEVITVSYQLFYISAHPVEVILGRVTTSKLQLHHPLEQKKPTAPLSSSLFYKAIHCLALKFFQYFQNLCLRNARIEGQMCNLPRQRPNPVADIKSK